MKKIITCILLVLAIGVSYPYGQAGMLEIGTYAYLTTVDTTVVTTAGTYYPIEGVFSNAPAELFTPVSSPRAGLRYDGVETLHFEIDWHASARGDANGITAHIGAGVDGVVPCPCSIMGTFLKTANEAQALSGTCVIELAQNEVITLLVTADTNLDEIAMVHFTVSIRRFFR